VRKFGLRIWTWQIRAFGKISVERPLYAGGIPVADARPFIGSERGARLGSQWVRVQVTHTLQPDIENCTSTSFRRIFDNLYMHSFKTSEGFIPVVVGVSLVAADTRTTIPDPRTFMRTAYDALTRSFDTGIITVVRYRERIESPART